MCLNFCHVLRNWQTQVNQYPTKRFWSYIRYKKSHDLGIAPVKDVLCNKIDRDAFVLLTPESIKEMIPKQGLLLKFNYHYR